MDGVWRPDAGNFIAVALAAFLGVWLIDRGLRAIGWGAWSTSGQ